MKGLLKILLAFVLPCGLIIVGAFGLFKFFKKRMERKKRNKQITEEKGWKYFTLEELDTRKNKDVEITEEQLNNLDNLVKKVLDPLREKYGKPIHVNSGLRDYIPDGGSTTSDHPKGCAVDVEGGGRTDKENKELAELLLSMNLPFTQLINEFGFAWLHIALNPKDSRKRLTRSTGDRKKPTYAQCGTDKTKWLA